MDGLERWSMKVKIYNDIWKVKLVNADAKKMNPDKNHINFGLTEYAKGKISIRVGLSESVARSTVIQIGRASCRERV